MTEAQQTALGNSSPGAGDLGIQDRVIARFLELLRSEPSAGEPTAAAFADLAATGRLGDRAAIKARVLQAVRAQNDPTANP